MKRDSLFWRGGLKAVLVVCLGLSLAQCPVLADGVTRSVEPVAGGCKVTLAWDFSGHVESDLVIEERLAPGWSVVDSTVPFGSLDASWLSGPIARFAVKPALLSQAGSISFEVVCADGGTSGAVVGDWKMYLAGSLKRGAVAGAGVLETCDGSGTAGATGSTDTHNMVEAAVAIKSFNVNGGSCELSYAGAAKPGTLVVEGCKGLGKAWGEIKRAAIPAGDGKIRLEPGEIGGCTFFRLKLLTVEE